MSTLVELKDVIDAGETIKKEDEAADGYEAVTKIGEEYCHIQMFDRTYFATFNALFEHVEGVDLDVWGEYYQDDSYHDAWEVQPPLTEEEEAKWKPLEDALVARDKDAAVAFLGQHMESILEEHKEEMLHKQANGRTRYTLAECETFVNDGKIVRCVGNNEIALYRWKEYYVFSIHGVQQFFTTFPAVVTQAAQLSYIDHVGHLTQRATWYVAEESKSFEILGSPVALEV